MISLHAAISSRRYEPGTLVPQLLIYQLIESLASTMEAKWSRFLQGLYHVLWYITCVAPTLPRPVVGRHSCSADERFRPALNKAEGCEKQLLDCAEATEDGWEHARPITDMCVLIAPFHCIDIFTQRWKGASARGQTEEVMERGRRLDAL